MAEAVETFNVKAQEQLDRQTKNGNAHRQEGNSLHDNPLLKRDSQIAADY